MKTKFTFLAFVLIAFFACKQEPKKEADTIYIHGKIYTVNEDQPWAEAIAVKDGKFLKIGSLSELEAFTSDQTKVVDLEGKLVVPGFIDTHSHPGVAAYDLFNKWELPSTFDNPTWEQLEQKIKEGQVAMAEEPWFLGHSYTRTAWPSEKYNRWYLDEVFGDQPVFIYMEGQHESIANSKALELAGIDKNTPDPTGARLGRDANGELNGVLYEDPAASLIEQKIPPISLEKKSEGLIRAMALMHAYGYTGAFDAQYGAESTIAAYGNLMKSGPLPMHIKVVADAFGYGGPDSPLSATQVTSLFEKHGIPKSMRSVKVQMDGSIEGYTSYMLEGYADRPEYNSPLMASKEEMLTLMRDYDAEGLQIMTHAIGDGTVNVNLDLYEELIKAKGGNELRHKIDHLVVVSEQDILRFAELGIPACPLNVVHQDMPYTRQLMDLLGPKALNTILPVGRLMNAGVIVSATSDWPGSPEINPFHLIEIMVTRKGLGGSGDRIGPEEDCISVEQAIKSFTWNGAWVMGLENETGSIEEGKWADFVVLDQNIFEILPEKIGNIHALKTFFKGNLLYDASINTRAIEDYSTEEIWNLMNDYHCKEINDF